MIKFHEEHVIEMIKILNCCLLYFIISVCFQKNATVRAEASVPAPKTTVIANESTTPYNFQEIYILYQNKPRRFCIVKYDIKFLLLWFS